jgi:hypothetical protein
LKGVTFLGERRVEIRNFLVFYLDVARGNFRKVYTTLQKYIKTIKNYQRRFKTLFLLYSANFIDENL